MRGRCYCGAHEVVADASPLTVVHCHCEDCRRVTGGAFGTFVAFVADAVRVAPEIARVSHFEGVSRRFCAGCGSALTAEFAYLPGQVYVPIGVLEGADAMVPELHCHADKMVAWLHLDDGLPQEIGSGQDTLNEATS